VGNGATGAFHVTTIDVAVVVTTAPLTMFGMVLVVGHAGATIDVVADAPIPSDVNGVTRYVYTVPGVKPVSVVVNKAAPALFVPRFALNTVHEVPLSVLCSNMYP
jgi:hypothetical protein